MPNMPHQTYQTKPNKQNLPNQTKRSLTSLLNQSYQTKITGRSSQRLGPKCLWQCFFTVPSPPPPKLKLADFTSLSEPFLKYFGNVNCKYLRIGPNLIVVYKSPTSSGCPYQNWRLKGQRKLFTKQPISILELIFLTGIQSKV